MPDTNELLGELAAGVNDWKHDRETMNGRLDEVEARFERMSLEPASHLMTASLDEPFLDHKAAAAPHFGLDVASSRDVRPGALVAAICGGAKVAKGLREVERWTAPGLVDTV